eukprot:8880000-Alexandrium_andersonii.AAC.1
MLRKDSECADKGGDRGGPQSRKHEFGHSSPQCSNPPSAQSWGIGAREPRIRMQFQAMLWGIK